MYIIYIYLYVYIYSHTRVSTPMRMSAMTCARCGIPPSHSSVTTCASYTAASMCAMTLFQIHVWYKTHASYAWHDSSNVDSNFTNPVCVWRHSFIRVVWLVQTYHVRLHHVILHSRRHHPCIIRVTSLVQCKLQFHEPCWYVKTLTHMCGMTWHAQQVATAEIHCRVSSTPNVFTTDTCLWVVRPWFIDVAPMSIHSCCLPLLIHVARMCIDLARMCIDSCCLSWLIHVAGMSIDLCCWYVNWFMLPVCQLIYVAYCARLILLVCVLIHVTYRHRCMLLVWLHVT